MLNTSVAHSLYEFRAAYHGVTTIHPLALGITITCVLTTLAVKRKYAIIPMLFLACFIAPAQRIVFFGLDFNLLRVMVLAGWLRVFLKQEIDEFAWKSIDKVMIAWGISGVITYILLRGGATEAIIYKLGSMFDAIGMYFLFRCLVRDMEDVKQSVIGLAYLSLPVAVFLYVEKQSGRNLFAIFGGIPEITALREGKLRAQGAFAHPITTGCFWVTQLPLFLALWWQDAKKMLIAASAISVLFIIYACASSTPASGLAAVAVGFAFYALRHRLTFVRWGLLATLVALHLVMKAPVWNLIARVDIVGGSTGWHRYNLIDQAIHRFSEWWLLGTLSTAHWGWSLADTANMYVNEAVRGGFLTLIFFVAMIFFAFKGIGSLLLSLDDSSPDYIFVWALGVALFTHCLVFIGVAYFGQIIVVWYLLLAVIGSLTPVSQPVHTVRVSCSLHNRMIHA